MPSRQCLPSCEKPKLAQPGCWDWKAKESVALPPLPSDAVTFHSREKPGSSAAQRWKVRSFREDAWMVREQDACGLGTVAGTVTGEVRA